MYKVEVCIGRIFKAKARPAQSKDKNFGSEPVPAKKNFRFRLDRLSLSDFKTDSISKLHKINVFFADDLFFCNILKN